MSDVQLKVLVGALLFSAWLLLTFYPQKDDAAIITFIQMSLAGLAGHLATPKGNSQ